MFKQKKEGKQASMDVIIIVEFILTTTDEPIVLRVFFFLIKKRKDPRHLEHMTPKSVRAELTPKQEEAPKSATFKNCNFNIY